MNPVSRLLIDFRSIFGAPDAPQPGEFADPDPATVCATRLELERIRRQNLADATPVPFHSKRPGAEL